MNSFKTTMTLLGLSAALIFILMSADHSSDAFTMAAAKIGSLWIISLISLPLLWIYCKLFNTQGSYLKQFNYMLSFLFLVVFISWF